MRVCVCIVCACACLCVVVCMIVCLFVCLYPERQEFKHGALGDSNSVMFNKMAVTLVKWNSVVASKMQSRTQSPLLIRHLPLNKFVLLCFLHIISYRLHSAQSFLCHHFSTAAARTRATSRRRCSSVKLVVSVSYVNRIMCWSVLLSRAAKSFACNSMLVVLWVAAIKQSCRLLSTVIWFVSTWRPYTPSHFSFAEAILCLIA